jgi:hypothetical protein
LRTQKSDLRCSDWIGGIRLESFDLVLGAMNGGDEVVAAPVGPPQPLEWKFSQVFGERTAGEEVQEGITVILVMIISIMVFGN